MNEFIECSLVWSQNFNAGKARVDALLTDPEFDNIKSRAAGHDLIEHLWQSQRINDVATQFDYLGNHSQNLADEFRLRQLRKPDAGSTIRQDDMAKNDDLAGLTDKIAARLATKAQVFIIHPAELRVLRSMTDQELRSFAAHNGWRVVRRLGGRQIEFYNDAGTKATA